MNEFEALILKFQRTGETDKAKWLENIDKKIMPSFKQRIIENDRSVLRELILPKWLTWDILRAWALQDLEKDSCHICSSIEEEGIVFKGNFICTNCVKELKIIIERDLE